MKTDIHPTYYPKAKVKCACGKVFEIGSTKAELQVEICSNCHPFFTGKEKLIDTAGKVEKFKARREKAASTKTRRSKAEKKAAKTAKKNKKNK